MTARKPNTGNNPGPRGQEIPASQSAEVEKDVVGGAKHGSRLDAVAVAQDIAANHEGATATGNRLTLVYTGNDGLVQTFHATVEEGIREF